eukprot:gnl/MRDRNA2_/MRDRNA2_82693_c0_seq1.p4 gnl/MRDRNA2_/MRDRNA2_82693_c0~~gnl/MRDRNA2_/MRDRNA2_82693_c0_seq1.p4  ORF type:complete len:110 (+),score=18.60 gnl/MRDRNA2_/MRDRNA2_82693_c0_seq1:382-711(+)
MQYFLWPVRLKPACSLHALTLEQKEEDSATPHGARKPTLYLPDAAGETCCQQVAPHALSQKAEVNLQNEARLKPKINLPTLVLQMFTQLSLHSKTKRITTHEQQENHKM